MISSTSSSTSVSAGPRRAERGFLRFGELQALEAPEEILRGQALHHVLKRAGWAPNERRPWRGPVLGGWCGKLEELTVCRVPR